VAHISTASGPPTAITGRARRWIAITEGDRATPTRRALSPAHKSVTFSADKFAIPMCQADRPVPRRGRTPTPYEE
jgi:hypothetical protein